MAQIPPRKTSFPPSDPAACEFGPASLYRSMSEHKVTLTWKRGDAPFEYQKYPRDHTWKFDGGHEMTATAAPAYLGNPKNVDPEEAFVASLSSCHMLTFLAIACKKKFVLDEYTDDAVGHMEKNEKASWRSRAWSCIPRSSFPATSSRPRRSSTRCITSRTTECFIANSVKTEVTVEK